MDFQDESYVTAALLYQPTAKDAVGKTLRLRNALQYDGENLRLDLSGLAEVQYPVSIEFTLNMYKKKQADSCVMSGYPNSNQYLDNYLHVGRFDDLGNTESLLRFESSLYKTVAAEKVISAVYCFSGASSFPENDMQAFECDKEWASTKVTWNTRDKYPAALGAVVCRENEYSCDITPLLKKWIDGSGDSHFGFQLTAAAESEGVFFPSADNGYCSPYLVVEFH